MKVQIGIIMKLNLKYLKKNACIQVSTFVVALTLSLGACNNPKADTENDSNANTPQDEMEIDTSQSGGRGGSGGAGSSEVGSGGAGSGGGAESLDTSKTTDVGVTPDSTFKANEPKKQR
jgi:uncharacterized membrane protein YgcG